VAKVVTLGLVPVSLALIAMADTIVAWAYGAHFAPAVSVLRLLALSLPLHALNGALGQALQAGGEQRAMVGVVSFGFLVHLVLNIALVHWLGIRGAALAMLISSSCVAAGALRAVHQRIAPVHVTAGLIPAALAVAGPLLLVSLAPGGFQIAAAMFGCVWLVLGAFLSGMLVPADIEGIRSALGSPRAGATA
jgi:O-antigen/teichoic acid export membrane protein